MTWCHSKKRKINLSKCVGILHARFTNGKEIYIIALSGTGYKLDVESPGVQIAPYNTVWTNLNHYLNQLPDIPKNVIVAEFDAVHKACLIKYGYKIIDDQELFKGWIERLKYWIGEWHKHYKKWIKMKKKFTIKWLVEQGMKDTYLEQMKVEAPSEAEAIQRFEDIVDFLTDCIPEYQPNGDRIPLRMKIIEILFTKTPTEIENWFVNELATTLSQYRTDFERLCREFMSTYHTLLVCWDVSCTDVSNMHVTIDQLSVMGASIIIHTRGVQITIPASNIKRFFKDCFDYWQQVGELICREYKREYNEIYHLPKGYTTVSMIWGGILKGGFKYGTGITNFFIQCAEDNALCTLAKYAKENKLQCQEVSWNAFQYKNKCKKGECEDIDADCEHDKCKGKECKGKDFKCYSIEHKDLCAFCKQTFKSRVAQALSIAEDNIQIEDENVSSDSDEEDSSYGILSVKQ